MFINEPIIKQICYNWKIGITEPKFALLDNGTQVIVKLFNGPEGNLVLFNEYLCYRLAIILDIPMPHSGICIMDDSTEIQDISIASDKNIGKAFYSTYLPKTTKLLPTIINCMKNKDAFIRVLLFDHVIFNSDRNEGNLLVSFYKKDINLKVIDHSHVFVNQALWDSNCLERAINENDLLSTKVLEYNKTLYDMFFHNIPITKDVLEKASCIFKSKINYDTISKLISCTPDEWKPNQKDIEALIKYIMYRVDNLDMIISTIIKYRK